MVISFLFYVRKVQKLVTFLSHFTFINIRIYIDNQLVMMFYCILKKYSLFVALYSPSIVLLIYSRTFDCSFPPI